MGFLAHFGVCEAVENCWGPHHQGQGVAGWWGEWWWHDFSSVGDQAYLSSCATRMVWLGFEPMTPVIYTADDGHITAWHSPVNNKYAGPFLFFWSSAGVVILYELCRIDIPEGLGLQIKTRQPSASL